jgi:hypothetical protein
VQATQEQAARRREQLRRFHDNKDRVAKVEKKGTQAWRANQAAKCHRIQEQLQMELSLREKRRVLAMHGQNSAAEDIDEGISSFEKNFKRLGIGSQESSTNFNLHANPHHDSNPTTVSVSTPASAVVVPFRPSSNLDMMKELKEKRHFQLLAQKERASRRRKILVDQTRDAIDVHRKEEEAKLLRRLLAVGQQRRQWCLAQWRQTATNASMEENAAATLAQRKREAEATMEMAMARTLNTLHQVATAPAQLDAKKARLEKAREEMRVEMELKKAAHVTMIRRDIVAGLLDVVAAVIAYR